MRRGAKAAAAGLAAALAATAPAAAASLESALEPPLGGRPAGLGRAYTALAVDAYAPVWNPAGLAFLSAPQAAVHHSSVFGRGPRQAMSLALPLGAAHGGGAAADFSSERASYGLAYGRRLGQAWSVGASGRYLETREEGAGARGYAVDLAAFYRFDSRLSVGAAAANMGGRPSSLSRPGALEPQARLGAGYAPFPWFAYSLEGVYGRGQRAGVRTGLELLVLRALAARVGVDSSVEGSSAMGLTAGLGVGWAGHSVDFAFVPRGRDSTTQLSLLARFGRASARPAARSSRAAAPSPAKAAASARTFHFEPAASRPSGFLSETQADWERPREPQAPAKPQSEAPVQPGLIWLP